MYILCDDNRKSPDSIDSSVSHLFTPLMVGVDNVLPDQHPRMLESSSLIQPSSIDVTDHLPTKKRIRDESVQHVQMRSDLNHSYLA